MKASESNSNWMGRFLSLSAIIEGVSKCSSDDTLKLIDEFAVIYKQQEFLREGIQVALGKILKSSTEHLEYIANKFLAIEVPELKPTDEQFLLAVSCSSSALALYLRLRNFASKKKGMFAGKVVDDSEMLCRVNQTIKSTIYSFPRLHSSIALLVEQALGDFEGIKNIFDIICCKFCFNEDVL